MNSRNSFTAPTARGKLIDIVSKQSKLMQPSKKEYINFKDSQHDLPTNQFVTKIKAKVPSTLREAIESSQRMGERKHV